MWISSETKIVAKIGVDPTVNGSLEVCEKFVKREVASGGAAPRQSQRRIQNATDAGRRL